MGFSDIIWMTSITLALAGVQFLYTIQFAAGNLLFSINLCLDLGTANIIFATAGPISGFIVQPIVGAFSDNYTGSWGRRRPFILAGTIGSMLGLLGIALCQLLGHAAGDKISRDCSAGSSGHKVAIGVGIVSLWLMNVSVNVLMGPARAIINDLVEATFLVRANSIATGAMAVSAIVANLIGAALNSGSGESYVAQNPVLVLFSAGAAVVGICSTITMVVAKEHQHLPAEGEKKKTVGGTFLDIYKGFRYMPFPLFLIGMLYFLSWFAYTPLMLNQPPYIVNNVYGINSSLPQTKTEHMAQTMSMGDSAVANLGSILYETFAAPSDTPMGGPISQEPMAVLTPDPVVNAPSNITGAPSAGNPTSPVFQLTPDHDPAYINQRKGTAMSFYSLAIFAGAQFLYSLIAPSVVKLIGLKWAYFIPQLLATVAYLLAPFMATTGYKHWPVPVILFVFALVGPNFMAFNSVPFALVSGITSGASGGLYMGVLNSASVVAQTVVNGFTSLILKSIKPLPLNIKPPPQNVGWAIAFGGIFSFIACVWCLIFIRDDMVKGASSNVEDGEVSEKKPLIQSEDRDPVDIPSYAN